MDPDQSNIGNFFDAGLRMWSRLYWKGGINPVPSSPLKAYYPNSWHNCGGSSQWSCASTDGKISLIANHGISAPVVAHEFAHQLNNRY